MNRLKTTLLLSPLTVLMVIMGSAIGGKTGMVFASLMAVAMNLYSCWFSDRIVLPCTAPMKPAGTATRRRHWSRS